MTIFCHFPPLLVIIKDDPQRAFAASVAPKPIMTRWLVSFCDSCKNAGLSDGPLSTDMQNA